jgi:methylamine dehydrogenase accessory protein MauD
MTVLALSSIFYVSYVALWILLLLVATLLLLVYRHFGLMTLGTLEGVQRDGLAVGEEVPEIHGVTGDGTQIVWAPEPGHPSLVLFAAPDCAPCETVMPFVDDLGLAAVRGDVDLRVVSVSAGAVDTAVRFIEKYNPSFLALAEDGSGAFERYRVRVSPFAFVVGEDGRVRSKGLCSDANRLHGLLVAAGEDGSAAFLESDSKEATTVGAAGPHKARSSTT